MSSRSKPDPKPPAQEPRELTDELLELVIGGAGEPPPALLDRLLREGAIRRTPPPGMTNP